MKHFDQFNGAFTLRDSETDNETDKIGTEPVSVSVQYENFHTFHSATFIGLSFGFSVWQCEHTIKTINTKVMYFRILCLKITCMWKDYLFQTVTS